MPTVCADRGTRWQCEGAHRWFWVARAPERFHPKCDQPHLYHCAGCVQELVARCKGTDELRCGPCGRVYRGRVRRIGTSGCGVLNTISFTLTSPGDRIHCKRFGHHGCDATGPSCIRCKCTTEDTPPLAVWNAGAGKRFNKLKLYLERCFGQRIAHFKVAEVQDGKRRADGLGRGAVHYHVLLRFEKPVLVNAHLVSQLREQAIRCGFGHSVDVQPVTGPEAAFYAAKYASKSCSQRAMVPWRRVVLDKDTGELRVRTKATYRPWSSSRDWGLTMRRIKADCAAWWQEVGIAATSGETGPAMAGGSPGAAVGGILISSESAITHMGPESPGGMGGYG